MGNSEPSFQDRLETLARTLASTLDISTVLAVRGEAMGISAALAASECPRAQRAMRARARALRQARELRLQAELTAGELLLSLRERGLRRGSGGKPPKDRSRPSLRDLGFGDWAMAHRREVRARRVKRKSFNVRVMEASDLETIKTLIAEATAEGQALLHVGDRAGYLLKIAARMAAKRIGGGMLLAGSDGAGVSEGSAVLWKRLARLSEAEFRAAVASGNERAEPRPPPPVSQLRMTVTAFHQNEVGPHRQVYAAADDDLAR
jgi:hypothetical protein